MYRMRGTFGGDFNLANSAKTAKLKSPPNLNYYHHVLKHMALCKYFRRVNKDKDEKKLPVLPVSKEIHFYKHDDYGNNLFTLVGLHAYSTSPRHVSPI